MKGAVFLDRDGVLTRLAFNPVSGEHEPPHRAGDLKLFPHAIECLEKMKAAGYELFLVSNQPDYAKGKATLDALKQVHQKFEQGLASHGIRFRQCYYCYHHPNGVVPEYSSECECRKPKPSFLFQARKEYGVALERSWMVGDRDTDVECGKAAGAKTILIGTPVTGVKSRPDYRAKDLAEATRIILELDEKEVLQTGQKR